MRRRKTDGYRTNAPDNRSNDAFDVYLTFNPDGSMTETDTTRYINGSSWSVKAKDSTSSYTQSQLTNSNGQEVITVVDGDAHVRGTVNGKLTIAVTQPSTHRISSSTQYSSVAPGNAFDKTKDGNIIVEGNSIYNNNTDMLGLVADQSVVVDNRKTAGNIEVDAAIFARQGSWGYLDYMGDQTGYYNSGVVGKLKVFGSITQNSRGRVANTDPVPTTGFNRYYVFDNRFYTKHPPFFPAAVNQFQIVSWRE
ncbi:MAG TPA: hypothetical protein VLX91_08760 [Candidatus Acidoferrales bacterium]|nr:hypothetical protein [Candidatus Acidoferrales bacterium]